MRKHILLVFAVLSVMLCTSVWAKDPIAEARRKFEHTYPNIPVEEVRKTPIDGLYEIYTKNGLLFYFHPKTTYWVVGAILTNSGVDLTAQRRAEINAKKKKSQMADKLKTLPLKSAIKIGNGPNVVIEFSSPDCPYCRKAHEWFSKRTDVTRYVFLTPLGIHPDAKRKSQYIVCAEDKVRAFEEVYSGKLDGANYEVCNDARIDILQEHTAAANAMMIRGTPTFWIGSNEVHGLNTDQIEQYLVKKGGE